MSTEVSVIMSVYNGEKYLVDAIDSILNQTFTDLEFIIVNDGSTDRSSEILSQKAFEDARILVLDNESNLGLTKSLNRALDKSVGKFIARQDADDVSDSSRLKRQLSVLSDNPEIGLVGTSVQIIDENGLVGRIYPALVHDTDIRWQMLFRNVFKHSSIVVRSEIINSHGIRYNEQLVYAQDYELWSRVLLYCKATNIDEPLVKYRVHGKQISTIFIQKQQKLADEIGAATLGRLGFSLSLAEQKKLRLWSRQMPVKQTKCDMKFCKYYFLILSSLAKQPYVDRFRIYKIRRFMVAHILAAIPIKQWRELIFSGLYFVLLNNDIRATLFWPVKRLLKH